MQPSLGRWFTHAEDTPGTTELPVILTYGCWQWRFGGDPSATHRGCDTEGIPLHPAAIPMKQDVVGNAGTTLWVLIGMVLMIACANVANLLLVRTEGRQQEVAICTALAPEGAV